MSAGVLVAALLVAAVLAWLLRPLRAQRGEPLTVAHSAVSLAVLRDHAHELDFDLASGTLAPEQQREAREELERRALEEGGGDAKAAITVPATGRRTAVLLALVIPLAAALLYAQLGSLDAWHAPTERDAGQVSAEQIEQMVAMLAARLEKQPDDARGWTMLARSYSILQRYPEAARAYAKLLELAPNDAGVLIDYADALAMTQGRSLAGTPAELIKRALAIEPSYWKALAMAGTEAFDRKDYALAARYWEKARAVVPPDSDIAKSIGAGIAEARALAGDGAAPAPGPAAERAGATVSGTVALSPTLARSVAPDDTVFIFARPASGSKMPVAALRKQVKDLPLAFTLDDAQAMASGRRLSQFTEVVVGARVSRTGNALPQAGDMQGLSSAVRVGATHVAITIDEVLR